MTPALLEGLALAMRREDRAECYRAGHPSPLEALRASVAASWWAVGVVVDGQPGAVAGLRPAVMDGALGTVLESCAWVLTGAVFNRHRRAYLVASRVVLEWMHARCPVLWCWVDARHAPALRWARWAGCEVGGVVRLPPYGVDFVLVTHRR